MKRVAFMSAMLAASHPKRGQFRTALNDRIMEFARKEFGNLARKRFAEDLVEVLSKMDHEPAWTVTLGLQKRDGPVEHLQIRMTEDNRNLVRN